MPDILPHMCLQLRQRCRVATCTHIADGTNTLLGVNSVSVLIKWMDSRIDIDV